MTQINLTRDQILRVLEAGARLDELLECADDYSSLETAVLESELAGMLVDRVRHAIAPKPIPAGYDTRYGVILADPPWPFRNASGRGVAENHYRTMSVADICNLPVAHHAADDCVLYLWAVWSNLPEAFEVMNAWGFTHKTGMPWIKICNGTGVDDDGEFSPRMGTGFWVRGCSEVLLIGTRGKPAVPEPSDRLLGLLAESAKHSKKPEDVYELAERHAGPYLELFARERRAGWSVFGNEVEGSIEL